MNAKGRILMDGLLMKAEPAESSSSSRRLPAILTTKEGSAMYCPECGGEYREGFTECADCGVPLVDTPPAPVPHPDVNFITVLEATDPALLAMAESLLLEEKIRYIKEGDLHSFSPAAGPVEIKVEEDQADAALELLQDLNTRYEAEPDQVTEPD